MQGRTAVVTGASSGIGAAVARRLGGMGMNVVLAARRAERLDALSTQIDSPTLAVTTDLRKEADIEALFAQTISTFGGVDVLINNAGLGHSAPLLSGDTEHWREMLEVNVLALCVATRIAIADMTRRQVDGHVVHISSMAAHRVPPGSGVYSATKYAVRSLTEALRQELRAQNSGVRISAVSPGFVHTEFAAHYHKSEDAAAEAYGRYKVLDSEDVAEAVAFAITRPAHMQIHDILIRPTDQPS